LKSWLRSIYTFSSFAIACVLFAHAQGAWAQQAVTPWDSNASVPLVAGLPDPIDVNVPQFSTISVERPSEIEAIRSDGTVYLDDEWMWQIAPTGIIYRSYYAGLKQSRMAAVLNQDSEGSTNFDATLGARIGVFRYGNTDNRYPQGWQVDIEGAAFPRLDLNEERDLTDSDFRVGVPITYGRGPMQLKFGYYHISAHVGDEFLLKNPTFDRINYVRDGLTFGISYYVEGVDVPVEARVYGELDWSINTMGGAEPIELQFGIELVGMEGGYHLWGAAPFLAVGGHLREEVSYGGNFVMQGGALWHAPDSTGTLRLGLEYVNGKNIHYERFTTFEQRFGVGLWYDF
jgi:hypothetical protein